MSYLVLVSEVTDPHTGSILPPGNFDELLDIADLLWLVCTS